MSLPRFGLDEESWCVVVAGRRISQDALDAAGTTQSGVRALAALVAEHAAVTGLPLAYVHMGTTVNWEDERNDRQPKEGADAIIGLVVAYAAHSGGPVRIDRATLEAASPAQVPATLWSAIADKFRLEPGEDALYLAPAGWAIAELYDGKAEYDSTGDVFRIAPLQQTCAEDFPPGTPIDVAALPETVWLRPFYA